MRDHDARRAALLVDAAGQAGRRAGRQVGRAAGAQRAQNTPENQAQHSGVQMKREIRYTPNISASPMGKDNGENGKTLAESQRLQTNLNPHQVCLCVSYRRRRFMMSTVLRVSKSPVGSSRRRICGSLASERAMVTRCCSPPESSEGRCW